MIYSLTKYWGPGRIRSIARGRHLALVGSGQIDRVEARPAPTSLAEKHQYAAVRRPGRSFHQKVLREQPFAGAVGPHHTDIKGAALDLGEGNQIAARRPHRGAVFAGAEADPPDAAAIRAHHIELLRTAAIGVEHDLAAVGRIGRRRVDRVALGQ